jgi:uncharacterized protein YxeA
MKKIFIIILFIIVIFTLSNVFKKDVWTGYFYPDMNNLSSWIKSGETFGSIEECRDWVDNTAIDLDLQRDVYDYECGLNCRYKNGFNVCEETLN